MLLDISVTECKRNSDDTKNKVLHVEKGVAGIITKSLFALFQLVQMNYNCRFFCRNDQCYVQWSKICYKHNKYDSSSLAILHCQL